METAAAVVVHYSEIGLKGKNRGFFVNTLVRNIRDALGPGYRVQGMYGRVTVHLGATADRKAVRERLSRLPGIANFSFAAAIPLPARYPDPLAQDPVWTELQREAADVVRGSGARSFALRARRADPDFPRGTLELERELGGHVLATLRAEGRELRVDLTRPEVTCHVEIARPYAFVYGIKETAPGGLPVGASGRVAALLSAGFDSPVASYMMMKRGAEVIFVHFHSYPLTDRSSTESVRDLVEILTRVQLGSRLYLIPFGFAQQEIIAASPSELRMVLYRRMMMRIASEVARREDALGLVTGESLGQVASQTLSNMGVIDEAAALPVYRPLIGLNKDETIALAERIGTAPVSSEPVPDCCSLMVARHPATRSTLAGVRDVESHYEVDRLVREALDRAEVVNFGRRGKAGTPLRKELGPLSVNQPAVDGQAQGGFPN